MIAAYRDKSGAGDEEIAALMAAEIWLSAEEAVKLGFADRVEAPVRMAAHFDLSHFHNALPGGARAARGQGPALGRALLGRRHADRGVRQREELQAEGRG